MTKTLRLILGDQLNSNHSWYKTIDDSVTYVMLEIRTETDYATHHIQKVVGFFAAMQSFYNELISKKHNVIYFNLNDKTNLQILCVGCHYEKSRQEQDEGYLKINPTESSFNNLTDNILNSPLCKTHAFIETLSKIIPDAYNNKIYYFDINKCRKNVYIILNMNILFLQLWMNH